MEQERPPDTENVLFIDEYPHLMERRRVKQVLGQLTLTVNTSQIILFPVRGEGDEGA